MSKASCWPIDQKLEVFLKDDGDDYRNNDNDTDVDDFLLDDERSFLLAN
jgi:hypothetical protein